MAQETNLNASPYFDDFDTNDGYHKVLFKPGFPIQSRELTSLQSILQNQVEKFGQHFFKEGARVIPGNTVYNPIYYAVQLNNTYLGVPIEAYINQLIGVRIIGQTSGITAVVDRILSSADSERGTVTLYINYLSSSTQDNSSSQFFDGELLTASVPISSSLLGNTTIVAGEPFAQVIDLDATSIGSAFSIHDGVYFIRGHFVNVRSETILLDQYNNRPNYKVGLFVSEEIVTSDLDESLNDNSQGFNNYSAPGADRLKISCSLIKKSLTDTSTTSFVELAEIRDGVLKTQSTPGGGGTGPGNILWPDITDILARRTYAESGDYYVKPFDIILKESLNDRMGNGGVYTQGQFTSSGSTPDSNLALYNISPGKAFVRGYECETTTAAFVDCPKPRTTATVADISLNYSTGPTFSVNRVFGAPQVGLGNTYYVSLRDERCGIAQTIASGREIGVARVYDFRLESGSYNSANSNINVWDIALYDIQTITDIVLNEPITLNVPTRIKGNSSGATAFLLDSVSESDTISVYEKSGEFLQNESFTFDGIDDGRVAIAITSHSLSDVKSIFSGIGVTFSADTIQTNQIAVGIATISEYSGGISTVRSLNTRFPSGIRVGSILKYTDTSLSSLDPMYVKVVGVTTDTAQITGITTVSGVNNSFISTSVTTVNDLVVLTTPLTSSTDNTLYTPLPKRNISNVDLLDSYISIRKSFNVTISSNRLSVPLEAGPNEVFLPFDEERYALIRSDGTTEALTRDKISITNGGSTLQIYGLGSNNVGSTLVATLRKNRPTVKIKRKNRVNSILVDKSKYEGSGLGAFTFDDGLLFGNYPFGTRVQDEIISLNVADILEIHSVYEAVDASVEPSAPKMTIESSGNNPVSITDLVVGEKIVGQNSGAVAVVAERLENSLLSFIYKNERVFLEGEVVTFEESLSEARIVSLELTSRDISGSFTFNSGQESTFYDYGTLNRRDNAEEPTRALRIYFSNGYYDSTDDGDLTTVDSYNTFDFNLDIQGINGYRNTDIIDIRPKTSDYDVVEDARSPLEFYGRSFDQSGNSATNVLASDETINVSFEYYLGRIDKIYLTKDNAFQIKFGTPAENPQPPVNVDDALEIATVTLPAYLYDVRNASISFMDHKRYRMIDIKKLEDRIKNLEYYTTLSLLETNTQNLFVPDEDGLNRFKSGFFVDNFSTLMSQETNNRINNSIDPRSKQLKPQHYTTSIDLIHGPVTNANDDYQSIDPEGINIRKTGNILTLDYSEQEYITQLFGTRAESVTPFILNFWLGTLELTPSSDTWVDQTRLEARDIQMEGNFANVMAEAVRTRNVDPQTGFAPQIWGAWQTEWSGQTTTETGSRNVTQTSGGNWVGGGGPGRVWGTRTTVTFQETLNNTVESGTMSRTGTQVQVVEDWERTSIGDRVVNRALITTMRSRNVSFYLKRIKPRTRLYAFFDNVNVTEYCVPKLLEIEMSSGTFQVGETVVGAVRSSGSSTNANGLTPRIAFRLAQQNHREGPFSDPTATIARSPYNDAIISDTYSSTSTLLNIDTISLAEQFQGQYGGYVTQGMTLVGQTSGAQATITNVRLISDFSANLLGSFLIPPAETGINFTTGTKTLRFIDNDRDDRQVSQTYSESNFSATGTLETVQENIIAVRNARVQTLTQTQEQETSRVVGSTVVSRTETSRSSQTVQIGWYDPLAQSFRVDETNGVFITRCDVFFRAKDDTDVPVFLQIRTMSGGFPTQNVLPGSEITLSPDQVQLSTDGSVATSFIFDYPIYLNGETEYAICVASLSAKYSVYISRVGENDLISQEYVANQPYLGSLFKSQNASTWEPSQWEDLKFALYRAEFAETGSVELYNPRLTQGNQQIARLMPDSVNLISKVVRVGIGSTLTDSNIRIGNTVVQPSTYATGNLVATAGIASGSLRIINAGIGYTPSSGALQFNSVPLETITGNGINATANITINNGVAIAATVNNGGIGYKVGDVLGISSIGNINIGANARLSLVSIAGTNQLILDNVQGDFEVGAASTLSYINSSGITTEINSPGIGATVSNVFEISDGLHFKVDHRNHGMYSNQNLVTLANVAPDLIPSRLTSELGSTDTTQIAVEDSTIFETFENLPVSEDNPGYILIGEEIISYTSAAANVLSGTIGRSVDGSVAPETYSIGTQLFKYELSGVSLRRINKTHDLQDATVDDPITFDSYHIKIDTSTNGLDRSVTIEDETSLHFKETRSAGGTNILSTQNVPFEIITPLIQNVTVRGTSLVGEMRTISGTSLSGNELPYVDRGFETVSVNNPNVLDSTRLIASNVNEIDKLSNFPGNKSLNMRLLLATSDTKLSPVIDTERMSAILTSSRVNRPVENYTTDSRVNSITADPHAFQYVSKEIVLENSATAIKILVSAHITSFSDIRALYSISQTQNFNPIFSLFPGWRNLDSRGLVIDSNLNDGSSDVYVSPSNPTTQTNAEFKDYVFTVDNLPAFRSFRIKLLLTSTNQVYYPIIKDLRVISLA